MNQKLKCYLVVPVNEGEKLPELTFCARKLLNAAIRQAEGFVRVPVLPIGIVRPHGGCIHLYTKKHLDTDFFFKRGTHLFINAGLLVSDTPPIEKLVKNAEQGHWTWSGNIGSHSVHAMAFSVQGFFRKSSIIPNIEELRKALLRLTDCWHGRPVLNNLNGFDDVQDNCLPPNTVGIDHSPAMAEHGDAKHRPTPFDPRFLNTAFMEVISKPVDCFTTGQDTGSMIHSLLKQRDQSAVPWIFNALVNEIEHHLGSTVPESFPPEIHLSCTGRCNINCGFCNYKNSIARQDYVQPEKIQEMDYLRHIQTLRLSSGLGEPSLNPQLSEIIRIISTTFPHIQLGFFSNGIALNHNGLLDAIVGRLNWMNISLNAASPESYRLQCGTNAFERISANLSHLLAAKKARNNLMPLVMGSMVLNRRNLWDLPKMPALCRRLGIDRLTVFPFSALGYHDPSKFGPNDTLAACMEHYEPLYEKTIRSAEENLVTLEIPSPPTNIEPSFGMPPRSFYDFAHIESNQWPLGRFLTDFEFENSAKNHCEFLWRYAPIGSTNNTGHSPDETHFIYPCVGPLSSVDLSRKTAFRFQKQKDFLKLWQDPVLTILREAQHQPGVCRVCDLCRSSDVRNPKYFRDLEEAVARFVVSHGNVGGNAE